MLPYPDNSGHSLIGKQLPVASSKAKKFNQIKWLRKKIHQNQNQRNRDVTL